MTSDVQERRPEPLIDLRGRVALVTGGTRNIGRASALMLARAGADVAVIGASDPGRLDDTVAALRDTGARAFGALLDVADPNAVATVVADVEQALGRVGILVNNVGIRPRTSLEELTLADWDRVLAVNLRAPFLFCQALVPRMRDAGWGRVVNMSGIDAIAGSEKRVNVTTAKGGMLGLTAALAAEYAAAGVTVNAVLPGAIDTERHTPQWYPKLDDFYQEWIDRTPMYRLGTSDEVAGAVAFLASDLASYITGQILFLAGGYPVMRVPHGPDHDDAGVAS